MPKMEWSVCEQASQITGPLLTRFNKIYPKAQIDVISMLWESYKQELTKMAIHGHGVDVSQVGAPLANDMLAMNVLRPFSNHEMASLGGENAFLPICWQSSIRIADSQVWSIPLFADPYAILYWGDLIEKAGIADETQAFDLDHIEETFAKLRASGVTYPWAMASPLSEQYYSLHCAASWVWGRQGEFVSQDSRKALFTTPLVVSALEEYFQLGRFVDRSGLITNNPGALFQQRNAAVIITNVGHATTIRRQLPLEIQPLLRVSLPPGQPLVGGSSLVIWKTSHAEELAFNLVKFLTSPEIQAEYPIQVGQMPVVRSAVEHPSITTDPLLKGYVEAISQGRVFPLVQLGGLLEEQIGLSLNRIWQTMLTTRIPNLQELILNQLTPLARRYNNMMS